MGQIGPSNGKWYDNMKYIITESRLNDIVKSWLSNSFGDLIPYETKKYPNYIFYGKGGEVIFEYNKKNGCVYISYYKIWSFLESMFGMEHQQIQDLTKEWVEEHYKLKVTTTSSVNTFVLDRWRNITN
jgi:hypothetical protein